MPSDSSIKTFPSELSHSLTQRLSTAFRSPTGSVQALPSQKKHQNSGLLLVWFAFFCSGIAGLSYELAWARYLTQLFGAATPAVSATVSIFFLGLALGAAFGGRWFDKSSKPLLAYAILELCIGCCALLVPFFFRLAEFLLAKQGGQGAESPFLLFVLSTAILLIPTTLLGATFPAMSAVVRHLANPTYSTGLFYGFNTLGSVVGSLMVSFLLLPWLGQHYTTWVMALFNGLIACLLWLAYHVFKEARNSISGASSSGGVIEDTSCTSDRVDPAPLPFPLAMFLAGTSGFLAIGIEVLWTRALSLSFPASRYVFALVLAAYLVGIGLGSVAVGRMFLSRQAKSFHLLVMYFAIGVGSILTLFLFPRLMPLCMKFVQSGWLLSWGSSMLWIGAFSVLAMLPATLVMGAALPLLIGLATKGRQNSSQTAGRLYATNMLGGVVGSTWVTFWLLPRLGLSPSLFLLAIGYAILASCLAFGTQRNIPFAGRWITGISAALGLLFLVQGWYPEANALQIGTQKVLYHHDASSATLGVYEDKQGVRSLQINNQSALRTTQSEVVRMQYSVGHLSAMLAVAPKRVLLLGFGTGSTLAALSGHAIPNIDCVALLGRSVISLAPYFSKTNFNRRWTSPPHAQTRVKLFADDGRRALQKPGHSYDLIIGDVLLPRQPGMGMLLSVEHFRAAKKRLSAQGTFVTWLPLHQLGPRELASIIRTFLQVFPRAEGWVASWSRQYPVLGLVGRRDNRAVQGSFSEYKLQRWLQRDQAAFAGAKRLGQAFPKQYDGKRGRRLLTSDMLHSLAGKAPINCVAKPILEFMAPRSLLRSQLHSSSLWLQNMRSFEKLRTLQHTPWFSRSRFPSKRSTRRIPFGVHPSL